MNVIASKVRQFAPYVLIFGLLGAVYLLPPDTSLGEVRKAGVLRACMPPSYPPLVTGDRDAPGIDVEMLQALAKNLGVSLIISSNPAIGQDFNPRNWHVTRAQCEVLGGGVVASPLTKSFLETSRALRADRLGARGPDAARRSPGSARRRPDRRLGARSTGALELSPRQERGADHHA